MEDINVYDEDKAVAFIRKAVPAAVSDKCSDCLLYTSPSPRDM